MGFAHNNVLHRNHFRKDWQSRVKTWFNQPGKKKSRRVTREKKAAALGVRPLENLRPAVRCPTIRYNRKLRAGKGFSLAELKAAGIRRKEALSIGIPVDHRRRNLSEEGLKINVDRLTAYKARLIVFPRNAKKPAKTDSKDLDAQVTRDVNAAIPIPAGTVAEAPRKITDAERETNAYRTLRNERATARYDGARKVRAAKKAEEEEAK
ncbi:hypothetical protein E3Q23_00932 [Wallemia mellicola]|nr:hypothetical protein E3Q24_04400 [Wallemia mellicola]TIB77987.1 hypothetical protein E3Q23_00932 [Wallemia mellicola]TIB93319.1 ribosomal protein L13e [Wallemia mellicola]TIC07556.1 ribosomal protein L13e [Wallemia mellicola]TIC16557.1 ribosomal protein L13e [Wallemia mellicola]